MRRWIRRSPVIVAWVLLGTTATPAGAARWEIVPIVGYTLGGDVREIGTGSQVDFDASGTFGLAVGRALGRETRVEGTWRHQPTDLEGRGLDLDHLHFTGVYEPRRTRKAAGYVLASLGLTRLDLDEPGAESETQLSVSAGGGARVSLGPRLSLRLEARGWAVFTSASTAVFCSRGCTYEFSGDGLFQFEVSAGLAFPF